MKDIWSRASNPWSAYRETRQSFRDGGLVRDSGGSTYGVGGHMSEFSPVDVSASNLNLTSSDRLDEAIYKLEERLNNIQSPVAIVRCQYCGQWAAAYSECHKCGGAVSK